MNEQDERIARSIRGGESQAFEAFFERFGGSLLGYLTGMIGGRAAAEDLLQETVLRVHRSIDRYHERGTFKAWVYRIATNVALSELRRSRYGAERPMEVVQDVPDPAWIDPLSTLEQAEREQAVAEAMAQLPDDHRAVLLMRIREGLAIAEISRILRVPEGTVKSRIHYGVRKLREHLERGSAGEAGLPEAIGHDGL